MEKTFFPSQRVVRWFLLPVIILATGCSSRLAQVPSQAPQATQPVALTDTPSATESSTPTIEPTATMEPTATFTPTITLTPTITSTPTITATPTIAPSPTRDYPDLIVTQARAFCRYGPGKAYLYSHELNAGMHMEAHGRNSTGAWLWVKPENLDRHCWSAASNFEITGDTKLLPVVTTELPKSTLYGPPTAVYATRNGDTVTITWPAVWMTEDDYRGYMIEANVCQNGAFIFYAVAIDGTTVDIKDEPGCAGTSGGKLYTVEKHGYTDPIAIPWPKP